MNAWRDAIPYFPRSEPNGTPMQAGSHKVCMDIQFVESQEDVTWMCQRVDPFGPLRLACTVIDADPPQIITVLPKGVNDWDAQCALGHEVTHVPFGGFHQ